MIESVYEICSDKLKSGDKEMNAHKPTKIETCRPLAKRSSVGWSIPKSDNKKCFQKWWVEKDDDKTLVQSHRNLILIVEEFEKKGRTHRQAGWQISEAAISNEGGEDFTP